MNFKNILLGLSSISIMTLVACGNSTGSQSTNTDISVDYKSSPNYTAEVSDAEISADLSEIAEGGDMMAFASDANSSNSLVKKSSPKTLSKELASTNQCMTLETEYDEYEEMGWAYKSEIKFGNGNVTVCDMNDFQGLKLTVDMQGTKADSSMSLYMESTYLQFDVNEKTYDMYIKSMSDYDMAVSDGDNTHNFYMKMLTEMKSSGENLSLSMNGDFLYLFYDNKYACEGVIDFDADMSYVDETAFDFSCDITHNNVKVGQITTDDNGDMVVLDKDGNNVKDNAIDTL